MNTNFLQEYIHLEKLCNDIYGTNHGISRYIEDMEATSYGIQGKIPLWENTYKKLKELRWKRNQYVHEGNIEFNSEDTEWLTVFYRKIISGEDPLSQKKVLEIESTRDINFSKGYFSNDSVPEPVQKNAFSVGWFVALIIILVIFGILTVVSFL